MQYVMEGSLDGKQDCHLDESTGTRLVYNMKNVFTANRIVVQREMLQSWLRMDKTSKMGTRIAT